MSTRYRIISTEFSISTLLLFVFLVLTRRRFIIWFSDVVFQQFRITTTIGLAVFHEFAHTGNAFTLFY